MRSKTRCLALALGALATLGALVVPAAAQCPAKTTVADTLYNADGSLASGRVTIAWPTFLIGACQVIAGQATVTVTGGAFSVQLYPNAGALPTGTSFRITYALKSGRITTEYWVVPASATPVALANVRSPTVSVPNIMFGEAQVTNLVADLTKKVELPSPCPSGKVLASNGSSTPPQVDCVDPTSGSGSQHQVNGANLSSNNPVNFQNSSAISFSNPSTGNVQAAIVDGSIGAAKLTVTNPSGAQLAGVGDGNIAAAALSPNRINGTAVTQARAVNATSPLTGGGALSADRTIACATCEVNTNKGAASGYAALNASSKVVQDPASAQTTSAASKIPLADGAGKISDGWLSSNVSLLGSAIDLASEVSGALPAANGGTGASNAATSGRFLRADGTNFVTSSVAAAGAGGCTNQAVTALNDAAAPTCNTITSAYVDSSVRTGTVGPSVGGTGANNTATSGRYLRGDSTNFVTSSLAAGGAGSCTNQFVRATVDNAVPTCATVSLTADVTSTLPIANGGTNATTAAAARTSIGTGTIWTNSPLGTIASGATSYTTPSGNNSFNAAEANREAMVTRSGTLRNLHVRTTTSQSAGGTLVFTVRINESTTTSITCQFAASAPAGLCSDTSNTAAVVAGDRVSIRAVNNGSGTSASVQLVALEVE